MEAEVIVPIIRKTDLPQCEGQIVGPQPSYRRKDGDQCWRRSQYKIDGKSYCAFHAGRLALEALLAKPTI